MLPKASKLGKFFLPLVAYMLILIFLYSLLSWNLKLWRNQLFSCPCTLQPYLKYDMGNLWRRGCLTLPAYIKEYLSWALIPLLPQWRLCLFWMELCYHVWLHTSVVFVQVRLYPLPPRVPSNSLCGPVFV